jgi:hypothetical protein
VAKGATGACTLCGHNDWRIASYVPLGTSQSPTQQNLGGKIYPLVSVNCTNCGNTHLVNLLLLGFAEADLESLRMPDADA